MLDSLAWLSFLHRQNDSKNDNEKRNDDAESVDFFPLARNFVDVEEEAEHRVDHAKCSEENDGDVPSVVDSFFSCVDDHDGREGQKGVDADQNQFIKYVVLVLEELSVMASVVLFLEVGEASFSIVDFF